MRGGRKSFSDKREGVLVMTESVVRCLCGLSVKATSVGYCTPSGAEVKYAPPFPPPLSPVLHGALADNEVEHRGALLEDRLALEFLAEPLDRHVQLVEGEGQHARQNDGPHDQQREDVVEDEPATVHASTRTHTYIDHPSSASVV